MLARFLLAFLVLLFYALHQDFWFWRSAQPLVLGFLPPGLAWHAIYTLAASALMWLLARYAWPSHLDDDEHRP